MQEKPNFNPELFPPEQNKTVKSEKEIMWEKIMAEVEKITDSLGKGIDEKIKETVAAFLAHGFTTSASCEGHIDHGLPYPWVEVYALEPVGWREAEGDRKKQLEQEWRRKNLEQQLRMIAFLEEFYRERETPFDARLIPNRIGAFGGFRVQSLGAKITEILSKEQREQKLELYQQEMKAFTEFLKKKYFSGE